MSEKFQEIEYCVACGNKKLESMLSLEDQPLANEYLTEKKPRETYPLSVNYCPECFHCQLSVAVNPSIMFKDYPYVSSTSKTTNAYFRQLSELIQDENPSGTKILDIGSNDGSFLANFNATWNKLGVDPAINLISRAQENNVITIPAVFDNYVAELISHEFDVVTALNVFAHTSNPLGMLLAIKKIMKPNGSLYIQTSQADMVMSHQFDTVYHEHISFFNVKSMKNLLSRAGFYLEDVKIVEIHGNSYLWKIKLNENRNDGISEKIFTREKLEEQSGIYNNLTYESFQKKVLDHNQKVIEAINQYKCEGYQICSYGSAAKGNTFLAANAIYPDYIFDDTPEKIGKYSPIGNVIVKDPIELKNLTGKVLIVIPAWNFKAEILQNIKIKLLSSQHILVLTYYPTLLIEEL